MCFIMPDGPILNLILGFLLGCLCITFSLWWIKIGVARGIYRLGFNHDGVKKDEYPKRYWFIVILFIILGILSIFSNILLYYYL